MLDGGEALVARVPEQWNPKQATAKGYSYSSRKARRIAIKSKLPGQSVLQG